MEKHCGKKVTKKKRHTILWDLLTICQNIGVGVEFLIKENEELGEYLDGSFDCTINLIKIYQPYDTKDITMHDLYVLAHEVRHAQQYKEQMQPEYWLYAMGLYLKPPSNKIIDLMEDDADQWAENFIDKYFK